MDRSSSKFLPNDRTEFGLADATASARLSNSLPSTVTLSGTVMILGRQLPRILDL